MTETADCAVIGAGVVGLAIARALALAGREVVVLEAARAIGSEISARNSEVIHAGIYYPTDSLKARLCVAGRRMLYAYARERGIAAEPVGKLIVATGPAETEVLAALKSQAEINGVADLRALTAAEIRGLEPEVEGVAGLMSPSSGIVDSHRLMLSCRGDLEDRGGMIAFASPVEGGEAISGGVRLHVGGAADLALDCRTVVNSAGLAAPGLALSIAGIRTAAVPKGHLAKGNYFRLVGRRAPFRHLVYPVPEPGGLGVHATIDLAGVVRFGPDVQWIDRIDYDVAPERAERFYAAIRRYWPGLADGGLAPDYAGIRPKIAGPGEPAADFVIQDHTAHGVPGLVNLFGIESPGLTAALAIAERVAGLCGARRVDAPSAP